MAELTLQQRASALLSRFYGYNKFRPHQLEIITAAMEGRDTVVLMPTGGGKSICYQLPAMLSEGVVIVVSPLIALMRDQVTALRANGIPAASVNSMQTEEENQSIMRELFSGRIRLLYISPERLLMEIDRWSRDMKIALIAVDEAHCISQWGHDFRPHYTQLSRIKQVFPSVPVMALTATADRLTREDIARQLCLVNPAVFISSFDRPNISLRVATDTGRRDRLRRISQLIDRYHRDSGIVYCISRKVAENMDKALRELGYRSAVYHAGLSADERNAAQEKFINGDVQVVCATVAFGMGIDKSNIRWVVHNNLPGNLESYYQEIGRAGRDGAPAEALLFYSYADVATRQSFVDDSGQQALNTEKLARMKEFAESRLCRRRILLSYFNETVDHDCGNCDICLNPPERFDGTTFALMAMSGAIRTGQTIGITTLVNLLRGSAMMELRQRGFDRLPTFGVGRDTSFAEWTAYISQMIQLGIFDIAYNENNHLKVTPYGMRILKERTGVTLARYVPLDRRPTRSRKGAAPAEEEPLKPAERLLADLKEVRLRLARKEGVPPYVVFTDKALLEMVRLEPTSMEDFSRIEGVGERKTVKYWKPFVTAIRRHKGITEKLGAGLSCDETLLLLNAGYDVAAIAAAKEIKDTTVYNHLVQLIREDKLTDFSTIITREQYARVAQVAREHPDTLFEILAPEMHSGLVRVALAITDFLLRRKANK